jgi:hypothetical protein
MTNIDALLSSESDEHYTPPAIVEPARRTMGGIDLDPFSCALANTVVNATEFYSGDIGAKSGFLDPWHGRVFCNPPGGKVGRDSSQAVAWRKMMRESIDCGIFVCFNLGFLQVSQSGIGPYPLDFPICYPSKRVAYLVDHLPHPTKSQPNRKPSKKQIADFEATGLCEGDSPPGASCIVFVPPKSGSVDEFVRQFKPLGRVVVPMAAERQAA